ncbi:MAG: ankyrin repeat domain-containing protein [Oculatellaceae cyanobacterium bins.114]|nr:ankyrin repeat domain-containing protein [Oculatellaceae cyanobacterium bins.114]
MKTEFWIAIGILIIIPIANSIVKTITTKLSLLVAYVPPSLWVAASEGNIEQVRAYLKEKVDLNQLDMHGKTPLHWAILKGHEDIAILLVEAGADVHQKDKYGESPLNMAAMRGSIRMTQFLLAHGALMELSAAALLGKQDYFEEYLHQGGSFYLERAEMSLLHLLSMLGDYPNIAQLLIDAGADVNAKTQSPEMTPLMATATAGHKDIADLLIQSGARINAKAKDFQTSLHYAVRRGHVALVELLIEKGADVNADSNGGTPLCIAAESGHYHVSEFLIAHKANVNDGGKSELPPIHRATLNNHIEIVELLIRNGANANSRYGVFGWTPLFYAESPEMRDLL